MLASASAADENELRSSSPSSMGAASGTGPQLSSAQEAIMASVVVRPGYEVREDWLARPARGTDRAWAERLLTRILILGPPAWDKAGDRDLFPVCWPT
jgi:hypothetical protein